MLPGGAFSSATGKGWRMPTVKLVLCGSSLGASQCQIWSGFSMCPRDVRLPCGEKLTSDLPVLFCFFSFLRSAIGGSHLISFHAAGLPLSPSSIRTLRFDRASQPRQRVRRRAMGPNPLSCKRPKADGEGANAGADDSNPAASNSGRAKLARKRRRRNSSGKGEGGRGSARDSEGGSTGGDGGGTT